MLTTTPPKLTQLHKKLQTLGQSSLSHAELLAILLHTDSLSDDSIKRAQALLVYFGSLQEVFQSDFQSFCQHPSIGLTHYAQLHAAHELVKRFLQEPLYRTTLPRSLPQLKTYLLAELKTSKQETFACLFLDAHYRLICFEKLFIGTHNTVPVYPREVSKKALAYNCSAVIAVHNHPSGITTPSFSDKKITRKIAQSLRLFEVELLDHFIVAGNHCLSFKEQGLL